MEPQTKKYLIWGGVGVGALVIFARIHNASKTTATSSKKKPVPRSVHPSSPPPSTAGQYPPVGYPQSYNPYPPVPYTPAYVPPPITGYPGQQYVPPTPYGYPPAGYQTPYSPYGGYPGVQSPISGVTPPNIIGMAVAQAESILQSLGYHSQIISLNGIPRNISAIAYASGPSAYLTVNAGRVSNVSYNNTTAAY